MATAYLLMKMRLGFGLPVVKDVRVFSEPSPSAHLTEEFYCELSRATGTNYADAAVAVVSHALTTPWLQWVFRMPGMAGLRRGR